MNESDRNKLVREVMLAATANNKEFKEGMAKIASMGNPPGSNILVEWGQITVFGLATLVMLAANLCASAGVSWWVVFAPIAFEWMVRLAVTIVNNIEKNKDEKAKNR